MIMRTYQCETCFHRMEVALTQKQWDQPPPNCPMCAEATNQVFSPPAIGGSVHARAAAITESIIANDYGVANYTPDNREGGTPKVTYKDQGVVQPSAWQEAGHRQMLEQAISIGKMNRRDFGLDGLDILKRNILSGDQPDLIEASKRRAIKVY